MDTVIQVMNIFLAEALSLSWSTFILVRNKEIEFIIPLALSILYTIFDIKGFIRTDTGVDMVTCCLGMVPC